MCVNLIGCCRPAPSCHLTNEVEEVIISACFVLLPSVFGKFDFQGILEVWKSIAIKYYRNYTDDFVATCSSLRLIHETSVMAISLSLFSLKTVWISFLC